MVIMAVAQHQSIQTIQLNYQSLGVLEQGVLYLSEQAETLIKQDFLKDDHSNGAHTERSIGVVPEQPQEAEMVAVLQATIDTLQGQLEVKDRQIEQQAQTIARLTDALAAAQQTVVTAQALHAGTIQQQLLTGEDRTNQQNQEPERKQSWFRRISKN